MEAIKHLILHGIRPSIQRTEVMNYLLTHRNHPSVDTIFESLSQKMPTLSRTTIYNILNLFVEKGIARSISIDPRQCRYDGDISDHAHFLCSQCGELYDLHIASCDIETPHQIDQTQIYTKGICTDCLNKLT